MWGERWRAGTGRQEFRDEVCSDIALDVVNISVSSQTEIWAGMTNVLKRR